MSSRVHDPRYQALIEALREARARAGLTQLELAQRLKRRQQFISKFEAGERRLDVIEFMDIAEQLGLAWVEVLTQIHGEAVSAV